MLSLTTDSRVLAISCAPPSQSDGPGRHCETRAAAASGSCDRSSSALMGLTANWAMSGRLWTRPSRLGLPYRAASISHAVAHDPVASTGSSGTHRRARSQSLGTSSAASARPACSTSGATPKASRHLAAQMDRSQSAAARSSRAKSSPVGAREEIACSISPVMRPASAPGAFASTHARSRCRRLVSGSLSSVSRRSLVDVHSHAPSSRRSKHDNNDRDRLSREGPEVSAMDPERSRLSFRNSGSPSGSARTLWTRMVIRR